MYAALWRHLPGPRWVKAVQCLVLALLVVAACFTWVFPAVSPQDQRVISTSAVRCVGNTLILQGRVYSPPYVITAIGDRGAMRSALDSDPSVGTLRDWSIAVGLGYDVKNVGQRTFPAYSGSIVPEHASVPAS